MTAELQGYLETAVQAARAAGEILMAHRGRVAVERKGGFRDLVTEADRRAEQAIRAALLSAFPHHGVLGEEEGERPSDSGYRWLVDPLDGTTNFAHGLPHFAVSLALEGEGQGLLVGVVHLPALGETYTAVRGGGAYCNGRRLHVSARERLDDCLMVTGFPHDVSPGRPNNLDHMEAIVRRTRGIRIVGAAAVDLAYVAAGFLDAYWDLTNNAWDVAAGALLVTEAGGAVTDMAGGPLDLYRPRILASNGRIHEQLLEVLRAGRMDVW
ncbi:MAG: inositol monophosphatase [Limnochordales bacterium]|nr:inositol monophosphatase family protein [Limnochordales bacterium]